jgi:hypothetical protein
MRAFRGWGRRRGLAAASAVLVAAMAGSTLAATPASAAGGPRVLRVGSYHGIAGQFRSIQAAVNAAQAGDWILIGPGDYHERGSKDPELAAGVLIRTPNLHLRGMSRNRVIVDGTKRAAPHPCAHARKFQTLGPKDDEGHRAGSNGVEEFRVSGVTIENLTVCNYLDVTGENGNEIWWNGGDGSGTIGTHGYYGAYLTALSTYSKGVDPPFGNYGIFVSNADGPGLIDRTWAANMGDAAYYIGACPDCHAILRRGHGYTSALGYSGTNSGGHMMVERTVFAHNKSGLVSNSQNNDDKPSPQDGACPHNGFGPLGTHSCTIYRFNVMRRNNNPSVPGAGSGLAGASPVGSGVVLAGTRNITLWKNRLVHNGSWGALIVDLPDQETPPPGQNCEGGTQLPDDVCYFDAFGNRTASNFFEHNGGFGNPTNGDIGLATQAHDPGNCFHDNRDPEGLTSDPPTIQDPPYNPCGQPNGGDMGPLVAQAECASELLAPCPGAPQADYPRPGKVKLRRLPRHLPTMPNPCVGVPANPWCPNGGGGTWAGSARNVAAVVRREFRPPAS